MDSIIDKLTLIDYFLLISIVFELYLLTIFLKILRKINKELNKYENKK